MMSKFIGALLLLTGIFAFAPIFLWAVFDVGQLSGDRGTACFMIAAITIVPSFGLLMGGPHD